MASPTPEQVLNELEKSRPKVKVAITDIDGVLRGKYLHRDKFLGAARDGFGFCNVVFGWDSADVCYDAAAYTGWQSGYPDALCARRSLDVPPSALGRRRAVLPRGLRGRQR